MSIVLQLKMAGVHPKKKHGKEHHSKMSYSNKQIGKDHHSKKLVFKLKTQCHVNTDRFSLFRYKLPTS